MMLFMIDVGIVLVLAIFALVKMKYLKHKLSWIFILGLVLFVYVSFMASTIGQDMDLDSIDGIELAGKVYFNWLVNSFSNFKSLTTQAIKMDWNTNFSLSR